jgi:8-oxo-dGTP pyrophosphatase MutT (NUDIX family)
MRLPLTPLQHRIRAALANRRPTGETPTEGLVPPQLAAVAVLIAPDPESVLLIRRAEREGDPWSGHMGLPGGRLDPEDPDLLATALRETAEEVGYPVSRESMLGSLDDVWPGSPIPRLIVVRPYVFGLSERPEMSLSGEVAEAFWVPLAELRQPDVFRETVIRVRGVDRVFPAYHLEPGVVWGLTERILTPLLQLL